MTTTKEMHLNQIWWWYLVFVHARVFFLDVCAWLSINQGQERQEVME